MTRRDYETLCRVLKEAKVRPDANPGAEWQRRRIARALCAAFELRDDARERFLRAADIGEMPLFTSAGLMYHFNVGD